MTAINYVVFEYIYFFNPDKLVRAVKDAHMELSVNIWRHWVVQSKKLEIKHQYPIDPNKH